MPRYFLDFDVNGQIIEDDTGSLLTGVDVMHKEARAALSALAKDHVGKDGETLTYKVLVRDENREPVYSAAMTLVATTLRGKGAL